MTSTAFEFPTEPKRRNKNSLAGRIDLALIQELTNLLQDGSLPTSGRFLFYRLVARRIVTKAQSQNVSKSLTELRNSQTVPMSWVVDRSRGLLDMSGRADLPMAARSGIARLELDPWDGDVPMLIVESNSLAGVLQPVATEFRVRLVPLGGQASTGLLGNELPPYLTDGMTVLYLGDLDLSGGHIESSARLRSQAYSGIDLDWKRIALTQEQAVTYNLPSVQKYDKRSKSHHTAIECEALDQRILVSTVRDELEALLPRSLAEVHTEEHTIREELLAKLDAS